MTEFIGLDIISNSGYSPTGTTSFFDRIISDETTSVGVWTIVFTDLQGFTRTTERLGEHKARELGESHVRMLRNIIERENFGKILKTTGDGIMGVMKTPSIAVSRLLEIQSKIREENKNVPAEERLLMRAGIHMGEIFLTCKNNELDIFGRHVNRTQRVMSLAAGGHIYITSAIADNARERLAGYLPDIRWVRHGEYDLKGIGPSEIWEVYQSGLNEPLPPASKTSGNKNRTEEKVSRLELENYDICDRLGEGKTGVVYKVRDKNLGNNHALKLLSHGFGDNPGMVDKYLSQAKIIMGAEHPYIARVSDVSTKKESPFFVMEYIDGVPVTRGLPDADYHKKSEIMVKILTAVGFAHKQGILHNNLKPSNILLTDTLEPKILDFDGHLEFKRVHSDSRQSDYTLNDLYYISIEKVRNMPLTPASDIFSLGVIFYELLTSEKPFDGSNDLEILNKISRMDPRLPQEIDPNIPEPLQRICLKALEKDPGLRYQDCLEMADDIRSFLNGKKLTFIPRAYRSLMVSEIDEHLVDLKRWENEHLITTAEADNLQEKYCRLISEEIQGIAEARWMYWGSTLLHAGMWIIIISQFIWLWFNWQMSSTLNRIFTAGLPLLFAGVTAFSFRHGGYKRIAYYFFLMTSVLIPLFLSVFFREFHILVYRPDPAWDILPQFFNNKEAFAGQFYNSEIFFVLLFSLGTLTYGLRIVKTAEFTFLTTLSFILSYVSFCVWRGELVFLDERVYRIAIDVIIGGLGLLIFGACLSALRWTRHPFFYGIAAIVLVFTGLYLLAWSAPKELLGYESRLEDIRKLLYISVGLIALLCGFRLKSLRWAASRKAGRILLKIAPFCTLTPIELLRERFFADYILPAAATCFILLGTRLQMKNFHYSGLLFLSWGLVVLTNRHAHLNTSLTWTFCIAAAGFLIMCAGLAGEFWGRVNRSTKSLEFKESHFGA